MRERSERVVSPGTYVTECVSQGHFCWTQCTFGLSSRALVVITWRGVGCRYMMLGIHNKNGATTENQGADVKYMG